MTSPITPDMMTAARRAGKGKLDVSTLIASLVNNGHSEYEAASHVIAIGCPADVAYDRATELIDRTR